MCDKESMPSTDTPPLPPPPPPNDLIITSPPPPPPSMEPKIFGARTGATIRDVTANWRQVVEDSYCHFNRWRLFQQQESKESSTTTVLSVYFHCQPILQSGPTCGLVALMMCLKLVKPQLQLELTQVLNAARSLGITKYGEMFSVANMCTFIEQTFGLKTRIGRHLSNSIVEVVHHFARGLPLLVPYDADANYEPCLKQGTRAHWATLLGFCLASNNEAAELVNLQTSACCQLSSFGQNRYLLHIEPKPDNERRILQLISRLITDNNLFVYARQGKSSRLQIWNFAQLCESNANLCQVSNRIIADPERADMVFPVGGDLTHSLADQFVYLYKSD